ncbi:helix-turn-helix domain-containing protein [Microbacterium xylanilyticum]
MSTANPVLPIEEPIDVMVGRRVHTLMWEQRVKNKDVAELLGLDPTAIGKKLRAEQKFSIEQLRVVARRLDTTIAYLVGEAENPHPNGSDGGSSLPGLDSNQEPAG